MIEIKMDDGSIYRFKNADYTEYDITKDFVVVKNGEAWIGVFDRSHFISLYVEKEKNA